ncbi:MAG: hypothetical protein ABIV21_04845 [Pyrinomonadaceae bacterium]
MKNKFTYAVVLPVLFAAVLGCSAISRMSEKTDTGGRSNKTVTDRGVETVLGEETTGVVECDQVMDMLAAEMNNPDDNFVTKAGKGYVLNKIKESVKQSVEENKNDQSKMAKECTKFKAQLDKYKADESKKKTE